MVDRSSFLYPHSHVVICRHRVKPDSRQVTACSIGIEIIEVTNTHGRVSLL
jgi:predicted nucleic acid-binding Zn ribbon protein